MSSRNIVQYHILDVNAQPKYDNLVWLKLCFYQLRQNKFFPLPGTKYRYPVTGHWVPVSVSDTFRMAAI